eukprot:TRINITY_DN19528_c0_g1_i1.p1 TRINITY_DN19528_c0_g1~~TRINITY_DN19528_c0_g1_i1.p1  ORF type:complete len:642 (+),score=197.48 TRINITY_DN19528_c0_g1_i1:86-1927(+)
MLADPGTGSAALLAAAGARPVAAAAAADSVDATQWGAPQMLRALAWDDGELVCAFADGAVAALSPRCNSLAIVAPGAIRRECHVTAFAALREWRGHAAAAAAFGSAFRPCISSGQSDEPYLSASLLRGSALLADGTFVWTSAAPPPALAQWRDDPQFVQRAADGSLEVRDVHSLCRLLLRPSRRLCTATFPAEVRDPARDPEALKYAPGQPLRYAVPGAAPRERAFVWASAHFSTANCPERWRPALRIALRAADAASAGGAEGAAEPAAEAMTPLPRTLPLLSEDADLVYPSLDAADAPAFTAAAVLSRAAVAAAAAKGRRPALVYERAAGAVVWRAGGGCEALVLADASLLTLLQTIQPGELASEGAFFGHHVDRDGGGRERVYHHALGGVAGVPSSAPRRVRCSAPCPLSGQEEYALRPILDLMLHFARDASLCASPDPSPPLQMPTDATVHASVRVDGVGNFTAYRDGRVRVHYDDRCIVELRGDGEAAVAELLLPSAERVTLRPYGAEGFASGAESALRDYTAGAAEFREWAFMGPAERMRAQRTACWGGDGAGAPLGLSCLGVGAGLDQSDRLAAKCDAVLAASERTRQSAAEAGRRSRELLESIQLE